MRVLGIDTSCDETSVALVEDGRILRSVVASQTSLHRPFGGVVPEIAARAHVERMLPALDEVLAGAAVPLRPKLGTAAGGTRLTGETGPGALWLSARW